jgi:Domain of unknown function (DUF4384)
MKSTIFVVTALFAASVFAADEPSVSAKALFFGTDGNVMSVPTATVGAVAGTSDSKGAGPTSTAQAQTGAGASDMKSSSTPAVGATQKVAASSRKSGLFGASYFIRMKNADGSTRNVLANRIFSSGEQFQLGVKVNKPAYVYIFNTDSVGKITQLYPQPGQQNFTDAMGVVFFPSQGAFQFDHVPGDERVSVYLSPKPAPDLIDRLGAAKPDLVSDPSRIPTSAGSGCSDAQRGVQQAVADTAPQQVASKGIEFSAAPAACSPVPMLASKAIVFADDPSPSSGQAASYVVKQQSKPDEALHLELRLVHR